ncbi:MAG: phosphohydrolase, partial [Cyclobacteriaceae bacterium]
IEFFNEEIDETIVNALITKVADQLQIENDQARYFVKTGAVSNSAYIATGGTINILKKDGDLVDVAEATDLPNIKALSQIVKKHYVCSPIQPSTA